MNGDEGTFGVKNLTSIKDNELAMRAWTIEDMIVREMEKLKQLRTFQFLLAEEARRRGHDDYGEFLVSYSGSKKTAEETGH